MGAKGRAKGCWSEFSTTHTIKCNNNYQGKANKPPTRTKYPKKDAS